MVYVLKGWVKTYMEGQGETLMKEGSAWTQPPRIKHLIGPVLDEQLRPRPYIQKAAQHVP